MNKKFKINSIILIVTFFFITSCGINSKEDNFDFSNIELPKKVNKNIQDNDPEKAQNKEITNKLIPLKDRAELTATIKYGKENPFSPFSDNSKKFISDFSLKGFITVKNVDYAIVNYLGRKGIIDINSVGGENTILLPNNSHVKNINTINEELNIVIEDEIYTIKLNDN